MDLYCVKGSYNPTNPSGIIGSFLLPFIGVGYRYSIHQAKRFYEICVCVTQIPKTAKRSKQAKITFWPNPNLITVHVEISRERVIYKFFPKLPQMKTRSGSVLTGLIPPRQQIQVIPKVGQSQGQGH